MRVLLAGWFSFEGMTTTAGDVLARDVASEWLAGAGIPHDVATAAVFGSGVDIQAVEPRAYSHLLFVCGPFRRNGITDELQRRFQHCRLIGLNLSMLTPLHEWNPFDVLFERDSSRTQRPDIALASHEPRVPVVGFVLVHPQPQYGARARHDDAHAAIEAVWNRHPMARVNIDTCLEGNAHGLRTAAEIESTIARMDMVITTRLHGTVLALKHGVPPLAVDPIEGGAKIMQQALALRWPAAVAVQDATTEKLDELFSYCLTPEARHTARSAAGETQGALERLRSELVDVFL